MSDEKSICQVFGSIAEDNGGFFQLKTTDAGKLLFKYVVPDVRSYELVAAREDLKKAARELVVILMREVFGIEKSVELCAEILSDRRFKDKDEDDEE